MAMRFDRDSIGCLISITSRVALIVVSNSRKEKFSNGNKFKEGLSISVNQPSFEISIVNLYCHSHNLIFYE